MLSYKRCFFNLFTYFVVEETKERKKYEGKMFITTERIIKPNSTPILIIEFI
jgi:hypothetical protein